MVIMVTASQEDYLRAMYHLWEENLEVARIKHKSTDDIGVKSSEIAQYLDVSKASVSKMLNELANKGLIEFERYRKFKFTRKGKEAAKNIITKHRIIESFLKNILHIDDAKIHELAHRLEHAFDNECIDKLNKLLHNPSIDPHGKPIPK